MLRFAIALVALLASITLARGAVYNLTPATPNWKPTLASLVAGDTALLGTGDFDIAGYTLFTWNGQPTAPIVIQNAAGASPRIVQSATSQNILNCAGSNFVIRGISFTSSVPSDGANVLFENLTMLNLPSSGISANNAGSSYSNLTLRGIEIGFTSDPGSCIDLGCDGDACRVNGALIENSYCHDTCGVNACPSGSRGAGFHIKGGSNNVVVRNNVCYGTNGVCVLAYDDYDRGQNVIDGNLVLRVRSDNGIQVCAGAAIRNNIVYDTWGDGIAVVNNTAQLMPGAFSRNYVVEGNTVALAGGFCLRVPTPFPLQNVLIANNAFLCDSTAAGQAFKGTDQTGVTWTKNVYNNGAPPPGVAAGGSTAVGGATTELVSPTTYNFYPKSSSALLGAGVVVSALYDFDGSARDPKNATAGAYQNLRGGYMFSTAQPFKTLLVQPPTLPPTTPPPTPSATTALPLTALPQTPVTGYVIIEGNVQLLPNDTLAIVIDLSPAGGLGAYINVSGCVDISGQVNVSVPTLPDAGDAIPFLESPCLTYNGTSIVTIEARNNDGCARVSGTVGKVDQRRLAVLFATDAKCKGRGLSRGAIAGIAVGAVLLTAVIVLAFLFITRAARRSQKDKARRRFSTGNV